MKKLTEYDISRQNNKKAASKERLKEIGQKKIRTTMIGAIAAIEQNFLFLWENNPEMKALFEKTRNEILDKGNNQIRNFEAELAQYDVIWNKYTTVLPVKRKD